MEQLANGEAWRYTVGLLERVSSPGYCAKSSKQDVPRRDRLLHSSPTEKSGSNLASRIEILERCSRSDIVMYWIDPASGRIEGLVDVTELHDAERQREHALRLLSHDMRSPQASIVALVETERERGTLDLKPVRDVMERIERYARRSLTLADDFVQLARAESQVYTFESTSLAELAIAASDEVWPQAHAKRIQIDTTFEGDQMGWINANRSLMMRALVNVLNNAVKYSPPDTRIVCAIALDEATPPRVICSIRDEGDGITHEDQVNLFEPFRRFHASERPEVGGVGLGMAFVKTVVMRHGGDIHVESEPGKGTTLKMSLPARDAPV
ncbi:Histidine kinase-, DNA gyrase B-, and HSP90-like ATPase [Paraburkholderia lycopersici]|uniref:histidine kinase n=1 Tax=Paraburkholderia lycopersici TaxID=416944 RepID=A0A1G7BH63_9BURK|nr:Histidine kinase-, DNA gyrase B-, and HSP90-like ATPase [Paraburkholderia lycopersici]